MPPNPLFTANASEIDFAMVRAFLGLAAEESFTIDYKRNSDAALETVAAMANTYGGLVLVGVDADARFKDRPGAVVGVPPAEKERLVNKVATVLDPPWWCPEVVAVPTGDGDRAILIVRVDADSAPRPIMHKGVIHVRLDGRNAIADRRLARALFEESGPPPQSVSGRPARGPDEYQTARVRMDSSPDLMVRAICSRRLRNEVGRARLGGKVADAVRLALADPGNAIDPRLAEILNHIEPTGELPSWEVDDYHLHSRFFRLAVGQGQANRGATRLECGVQLHDHGASVVLEAWLDALYWCKSGERIPARVLARTGSVLVSFLVEQGFAAATNALVGDAQLPTPPVELYVASKIDDVTNNHIGLEHFVALEEVGRRIGMSSPYRGGEVLRQDLIDEGRWGEAVADALEAMAMDWQILNPSI